MTDHEPNDLSHLSDAEFNSLCPQGEHAPGLEPLSPAAQAVLDAFNSVPYYPDENDEGMLAAALRSVAYFVAPTGEPSPGANYAAGAKNEGLAIGLRILAIADELERQS
jgi:hypothetical protein